MIWVAWRQFRTQALVTLGLLVAFAVLVLVTGLHLRDACPPITDCSSTNVGYQPLRELLGPALLAIPALLGMFWGAPLLARELESGTYRLAWTQSVTRRRWLSVRVALVGLTALAVAGLASWLVSWWFAPIGTADRFASGAFDERGIVALGYAGFAFALGIAAGALTRRTLPAVAATLLAFVATRVAFTFWVRPHILAPRHALFALTDGKILGISGGPFGLTPIAGVPAIKNAGAIAATLVDRIGHAPGGGRLHGLLVRYCPTIASGAPQKPGAGAAKGLVGPPETSLLSCGRALSPHLQALVTFQPASHYWPLQALETAIFLAVALALIGATIWRLGRRTPRRPAAGAPGARIADPSVLDPASQVRPMPTGAPKGDERSDWSLPRSTERN
ncbi:MAG TPA: hypothetical protein VKS25_11860 [Solirubrobacteraceae bacterium]|nr:hypothetical protein [Solirubrobacteraceae bacterium]